MSELTISQAEVTFMKAQSELAEARAKLAPLEQAEKDAAAMLHAVILKFQKSFGFVSDGPARKKRVMSKYVISDASKLNRVGKSAYTRIINAGGSEKDAKAAQKAAETSLKAKLGVA